VDRILQSTPATISESWYQGATIQDPGTVTVTVTRDDGTIVTTGTAAGTGAAPRTFQLTAAHTASLDRLTATWTSPTLGTLTTVVEVVGDFLFTINEAHNAGLATYSDDQIAGARTRVEQAIEDACGLAFVPRYDRATLNGDGTTLLRLGRPFLRRVRWASTVTRGRHDVAADHRSFRCSASAPPGSSRATPGRPGTATSSSASSTAWTVPPSRSGPRRWTTRGSC
jgi:hypothetical protein